MKLNNARLLLISLIVGIVITGLSGISARYLWSSPGGSAYGGGVPMSYRFKYCGGYAPCYWTPVYAVPLIEDLIFWSVILSIILLISRRLTGHKNKKKQLGGH